MNNFPFAWYYVGVLALLLIGQQVLMSASHKDATARLTAQYEQKLKLAETAAIAACPPEVAQAATAPVAPAPAEDKSAAAKPAPSKSASAATPPFQTSPKSEMIIASPPPMARASSPTPLTVAFRSEPLTRSKVMLLTNTSTKARDCRISMQSASGSDAKEFSVRLEPGVETHVHGADGREFRKGDRVRIAMAGFAPKSATVD